MELIPKVTQPTNCQKICQLTKKCSHWTVDTDDYGCFLVDSPKALEYDDDKISGSKNCAWVLIKISVQLNEKALENKVLYLHKSYEFWGKSSSSTDC